MKKIIALVIPASLILCTGCNNKKYVIKKTNRFEYQSNNECAGYSSAYVLRSLGIDVNGIDIYNGIEEKNEDGTVNPTGLVSIFEKRNIDGEMKYNLTLIDLKTDLKKGIPIIVLMKSNPTSTYNHYVCLVGYDKDNLYFAESLENEVNIYDNNYYNRTVSNDDFINMWKVDNTYQNIYFVIKGE